MPSLSRATLAEATKTRRTARTITEHAAIAATFATARAPDVFWCAIGNPNAGARSHLFLALSANRESS
jgi:hypothetical protein